jgi:sugar phosphate isomerase/epimerase
MSQYAFRLGATSYVIPDALVANAHYLAGQVADMELVLFELEDGSSNMPTPAAVAELAEVAATCGLSYTVHLPLDLRLDDDGSEDHVSLRIARRVIERTRPVEPWAYVLHLDGRALLAAIQAGRCSQAQAAAWQAAAARALELAAGWAGDPERLAVENLERYPLDFLLPVLERVPVSRCVDVGHLWLDGHDTLSYLRAALPRTRVVHLHGLADGRDHQSLANMPSEQVASVLDVLAEAAFGGVVTLEVFGEADFCSSLQAVKAAPAALKMDAA